MKKTTLVSGLALLGAACTIMALTSWQSGPTNKHGLPEFKPSLPGGGLSGEDTIILTGDTIQPPTANKGFNLKNSNLYIANSSGTLVTIDSLDDRIDTAYMRTLYNVAAVKNHGTHFVTALQITYGIHCHKIKLYYRPLCLTRDSYISGTGSYSDHNGFDSNTYYYTSNGFVHATYKSTFQADSTNYIDSIRIRHHTNNTNVGYFYTASNDSEDVHTVLYSFQEIYALIANNPNSRYVKSSSVAIKVSEQTPSGTKYFVKHCLIFGPSDEPPAKTATVSGSGTYYNVYADVAHMCPPDCTAIQYQLQ